ncbi:hypothetical protein [Amycolatopsis sp. NPDC004378]
MLRSSEGAGQHERGRPAMTGTAGKDEEVRRRQRRVRNLAKTA